MDHSKKDPFWYFQFAEDIVKQTKNIPKVPSILYSNEKHQPVDIIKKISTNDLTLKGAIDK